VTGPPTGPYGRTIANNRLIHDQRTREFADRRDPMGDNRKDTLRVLKRYLARKMFTLLLAADLAQHALAEAA